MSLLLCISKREAAYIWSEGSLLAYGSGAYRSIFYKAPTVKLLHSSSTLSVLQGPRGSREFSDGLLHFPRKLTEMRYVLGTTRIYVRCKGIN